MVANDGGNLALYHVGISNCVICHSQTGKKCENFTMDYYG